MRCYLEHLAVSGPNQIYKKPPSNAEWTRPEYGPIKVNCDTAMGENNSYIAIVARDWRGAIVFTLSKRVETTVLVQAEAEAINWATQLAVDQSINCVTIESDSKISVNALI